MSYRSVRPLLLNRTKQEDFSHLISWRRKGMVALRIAFGSFWAVSACLAWLFALSHAAAHQFVLANQPSFLAVWNMFWIHMVNLNPQLVAYSVAVGETGIALCLIFGVFNKQVCISGIVLSLLAWSTASNPSGLYAPGSSDIGITFVYILVFLCLLLSGAGRVSGRDHYQPDYVERQNIQTPYLKEEQSQTIHMRPGRIKDQHLLPM